MTSHENAVLEALQRAQQFFDENGVSLTGVVDLSAARKRLDYVVTSFTGHAVDQDVADRVAKGETAKQHQLRMKLRREQMVPIALIARRNLRSAPGFSALRMPKPSVLGLAFIASARGMADAATIHKDTLVEHGLPSTFLDDLNAAVTKLEGSVSAREKNRTQRIGATKALDVEAKQGRTVLSVLDALMQQAAGNDESLLRAWQSARRIRRRSGPTAGAAAAPTPATAASPTGVDASTATPLQISKGTAVAAAA